MFGIVILQDIQIYNIKAVNILLFENIKSNPTLENHNMADRRGSADAEPESRPDPQFWQQ